MRPALDITPEELFIRILTFFSGSTRYFTADSPLAEVVKEEFEERDLWLSIAAFELTMGKDVPKELVNLGTLSGMTISEFARAVDKLPDENDPLQITRFIRAFVAAMDSPDQEEEEVHREEDQL